MEIRLVIISHLFHSFSLLISVCFLKLVTVIIWRSLSCHASLLVILLGISIISQRSQGVCVNASVFLFVLMQVCFPLYADRPRNKWNGSLGTGWTFQYGQEVKSWLKGNAAFNVAVAELPESSSTSLVSVSVCKKVIILFIISEIVGIPAGGEMQWSRKRLAQYSLTLFR